MFVLIVRLVNVVFGNVVVILDGFFLLVVLTGILVRRSGILHLVITADEGPILDGYALFLFIDAIYICISLGNSGTRTHAGSDAYRKA